MVAVIIIEPTVISNVNHEMDILREEVFGPARPSL